MKPIEIVDEVFGIIDGARDSEYIGEDISQLEHALQAAKLAVDANADDEAIIAALLHDIGHLCASDEAQRMGSAGVADHEALGAEFLRQRGFSDKIAQLVVAHVDAKRYLTYSNPDYYNRLSPASIETLIHQGGPMTEEKESRFERSDHFKDKLRVRSWDERAKDPTLQVPPLSDYRDMVLKHLSH